MNRAALVALLAITMVLPLTGPAHAQLPPLPGLDSSIEIEELYSELITPTTLAVADDGRVIVASREGQVTVWEQDGAVTQAAKLSVDAYDRQGGQFDEGACPRSDEVCPDGYNLAEGGIHGILLSPDFTESGELYLYYTVTDSLGAEIWPPKHPDARPWCAPVESPNCRQDDPATFPNQHPENRSDEGKFRLSRFTLDLDTNQLDLASELPLFENPAEWFLCCHYGGDLEWAGDGTLLMTVGDDTSSDHSNQYSPHDQRSDHTWNSAALSSQNLADRRGKVLRIDVAELVTARESGVALDDGWDDPATDGVPGEGEAPNPFHDDPSADPYVYAYGFRSNYRFAHNPRTGHLYVGTVGPDARNADANRGPAAHDEIETVPPGGGTNHGWPYCIADNIPYNRYDFETGTAGEPFSCAGMTPASVWYTYNPSPETSPYVQMGSGGNTAIGGVAYYRADSGALRLPEAYDASYLWMEHSRGQLWHMPINADGTLNNDPTALTEVTSPFFILGKSRLSNPIDATIGPDGAVYLLEGRGFWNSTSGRLSRLKCAGCAPDPADYEGAVTPVDVSADVVAASVDGGATESLPAAGAAAMAAAVVLGVALRRRRAVV